MNSTSTNRNVYMIEIANECMPFWTRTTGQLYGELDLYAAFDTQIHMDTLYYGDNASLNKDFAEGMEEAKKNVYHRCLGAWTGTESDLLTALEMYALFHREISFRRYVYGNKKPKEIA